MSDAVEEGARAAARRLGLVTEVEAALHAQEGPADRYFDPVSFASLIVSTAALAWTVYNDLKKRAGRPSTDVVTRTVTTQLKRTRTLSGEQEETVTVTVQETIKAIENRHSGTGG